MFAGRERVYARKESLWRLMREHGAAGLSVNKKNRHLAGFFFIPY
ncbi:hypothetical protein KNP414_02755 [Paenibacillus mucilaginosus KNP414]|uniref:Uncharacterized protein n=1 Tax=Paenibacillus mucilaginosus (strain KNP414) TaxID=1036673 RepID=F8FAR5_PAEMK|nr:hypothetical protein KNP414_02755 [Paenibacillus mucilaginosus KNP414]